MSALQPVADGSIYLARVEWDGAGINYYFSPRSFVVSSLAVDGSLGPSTTIPVDDARAVVGLATAPSGPGFALVWADAKGLEFAAFDGKGTLLGQPKPIVALDRQDGTNVRLRMAADATGTGFALALSLWTSAGGEPYALFLDSNGTARGPIRRLGSAPSQTSSYFDAIPDVSAGDDGYVFVWNRSDGATGSILFSQTDALGNESGPPVTIASSDRLGFGSVGFASGGARIVPVSGGFVTAWTESFEGRPDNGDVSPTRGAWAVVRLLRLDAHGTPVGVSAAMRAAEDDIDEVEPVLTRFGDALAVAWGRGSHIYMCGGCVPDDRIDFVLIDPDTFDPVSNVVTVTNGGGTNAGGLLRKQVAAAGTAFLTLYDLQLHTSATPGSAVFTCTR